MRLLVRPAIGAAALLLAGAAFALTAGYDWPLPDWMPHPPIPADNPMSAEKVELGRRLFYDARLSADGTVACASCHVQALAFSDGRQVPVGIGGSARVMPRHAKMIRPHKVHVVIGEPITIEVGDSGRAPRRAITEASQRLSTELQRLFDLAEARVG
jgi:cytochrome c peroxidase